MPTSFVCKLTVGQSDQLHALLQEKGWELDKIPYARWRGRQEKLTVVSYESGKLVVQGAETTDFVQFILEPQILGEARLGYEAQLAEQEDPRMFLPHAGIDESGKGDLLGPLCVACCHTTEKTAKTLLQAGVTDSKKIKSDTKMKELDAVIRQNCAGQFSVLAIRPETYNRLYGSFGNLNRLLAWAHAKVLENLLELVPDCPRAIDDQFSANKNLVVSFLQERGRRVEFEQHPRAEADVAVAAASILARTEFVRRMEWLSQEAGFSLPKGGGAEATKAAQRLLNELGKDSISQFAKLHFKNILQLKNS